MAVKVLNLKTLNNIRFADDTLSWRRPWNLINHKAKHIERYGININHRDTYYTVNVRNIKLNNIILRQHNRRRIVVFGGDKMQNGESKKIIFQDSDLTEKPQF